MPVAEFAAPKPAAPAKEPSEVPVVAPVVASTSHCITCGQAVDPGARLCATCGTPTQKLETAVAAEVVPSPQALPVSPREAALPRLRAAYVAFIDSHEVEWELWMAGLAVASTLIGLATGLLGGSLETILATAAWLVTAVFLAEFGSRLAAAVDRRGHLRSHVIDLIALVPMLRLARVLRLFWILFLAPAAARTAAAMGRVAEGVRKVRGGVGSVRGSIPDHGHAGKAASQLRSHRSFTWMLPAWLAAMVSSALFLLATQRDQVVASLLLLVSLALFSALTAAITTISLDRRSHTTRELPERLRELDQLRDAGLVTPAEHLARRAELLRSIAPQ